MTAKILCGAYRQTDTDTDTDTRTHAHIRIRTRTRTRTHTHTQRQAALIRCSSLANEIPAVVAGQALPAACASMRRAAPDWQAASHGREPEAAATRTDEVRGDADLGLSSLVASPWRVADACAETLVEANSVLLETFHAFEHAESGSAR